MSPFLCVCKRSDETYILFEKKAAWLSEKGKLTCVFSSQETSSIKIFGGFFDDRELKFNQKVFSNWKLNKLIYGMITFLKARSFQKLSQQLKTIENISE